MIASKNYNKDYAQDRIYLTYDLIQKKDFDVFVQSMEPPRAIINESLNFNLDIENFYCLPLWIENQVRLLDDFVPSVEYDTQCCFNFSVNKKQINRYLLIKFVEWFQLDSYDYTWSGTGRQLDLSGILEDAKCFPEESEFCNFLLSGISLPNRFVHFTGLSEQQHDDSNFPNFGSLPNVWQKILKPLMSKSAISLIGESVIWDRSAHFTEKTAFAIMAETFPIWIGGYGMPDQWKLMGFDIFDDLIDHSYQYRDSLLERCYYAFRDNLDLLQDLEKTAQLRKSNQHRLAANKFNLHRNLQSYNLSHMQEFPPDIAKYFQQYRKKLGI